MPNRIPLIDRILLDEATGCWNWKGSRVDERYGQVHYKGRTVLAHRLSAHLWLGIALDDERRVLHRCDNPRCFNPKHLFLGTQLDNLRDCVTKGRHAMANRTHCPKGHPYDETNTLFYVGKNYHARFCLTCKQVENKRRRGGASVLDVKVEPPTP